MEQLHEVLDHRYHMQRQRMKAVDLQRNMPYGFRVDYISTTTYKSFTIALFNITDLKHGRLAAVNYSEDEVRAFIKGYRIHEQLTIEEFDKMGGLK